MDSLAGFNDLKQVLDLINNYESYTTLLKELEVKYNAAADIVALVGPAEEIMSMHTLSKIEKAEADTILKGARTEYDNAIKEAKDKAKKLLGDVADLISTREQTINDSSEKLHLRAKELAKLGDDLTARELALVESEELVSQQTLKVTSMRKELKTKLDEINDKFKV
jgi:vacuolar-type H+-ATPase subunit H